METIGLIGGMSWESTVPCYREINEAVRDLLGGLHSAKILLYSLDFAEIEALQQRGEWDEAGAILARAAETLERAGADFLVVCSNTMHKVIGHVERATTIPVLHIADTTAAEIRRAGLRRVGLLATRFTMEHDFYRGRLEAHGVDVVVPDEADREIVHRIIYDELCVGRIRDESRREYRRVIAGLEALGVEGVILGCTEIGLLVGAEDSRVPLFDTAAIHARAAAERAVGLAKGA